MFEITMAGAAKNALSTDMMQFLLDKIEEASGRPILLTGTGDAFSAGLHLKEVAALDPAGMEAFLRRLEQLMSTYFSYPAPVVGLINGHAIAGGCMLTLCCDHRVAPPSPKSRIGLNELALGLAFPPKVMAIVRHRVPRQHIDHVVLGAGLHDPTAALRLGLLDEVVEDARAAAEAELTRRASYDAAVYAATKATLRADALREAEKDESFFTRGLASWNSPALRKTITALLAPKGPR